MSRPLAETAAYRRRHCNRQARMGDIGPVRRRVDLEPLPESVPITEPSPATTPSPTPARPLEPAR